MLSTATPLMQRILTSSDWPVVAFLLEVPIKQYPNGVPKWFNSIQREEVPKLSTNEPIEEGDTAAPMLAPVEVSSVPTEQRDEAESAHQTDTKNVGHVNSNIELPSPGGVEWREELEPPAPVNESTHQPTMVPASLYHLSDLPNADIRYSKKKKKRKEANTKGDSGQADIPTSEQPLPRHESSEVLLKPFKNMPEEGSARAKLQPDTDSLDGVPPYYTDYDDISFMSSAISMRSCSNEGMNYCDDFIVSKRRTPSGNIIFERKLRKLRPVKSEYSSKERLQCTVTRSFSSSGVTDGKSLKRSDNSTATTSLSTSPYLSNQQSPASSGVCSPQKYTGPPLTRSDMAYLRGATTVDVCSDGTPTTPTTPATPGDTSEATGTDNGDGTDSTVSASVDSWRQSQTLHARRKAVPYCNGYEF